MVTATARTCLVTHRMEKLNVPRFKFGVFWQAKCLLLGGTVNLTGTLHEEIPCKVQPGSGLSPESHATLFSGSLCGGREDFNKMADLKGLAECLACTVASRYLLPLLCGNSQKKKKPPGRKEKLHLVLMPTQEESSK